MAKDHNGKIHRTETPDVSHIRNVEVTHQRSDVNVGAIVKFILLLSALTVTVYVLMWGMFRFFYAQGQKEPEPGPMAMSQQERLPPEPRLQSAPGFAGDLAKAADKNAVEPSAPTKEPPKDPKYEIRVLQELWDDQLRNGPRDANGNVVGLPIDEAIKRVAEGGLPSRATGPMKPDDFAVSIPTAASSGRMTEKRLQ
jgi:hypothetical protein